MKTKIYIKIPAGAVAGGVESLYQLADGARKVGVESFVVYDNNHLQAFPQKYHKYEVHIANHVEDDYNNWVIYPEVWTERLQEYQNVKKAVWWLSVDNNHSKFQDFANETITHFYQSYYAFAYLLNNGATKCLPIFDYIDYVNTQASANEKTDIVVYNPAKGLETTNALISLYPDIQFVPIINMQESEVIDLLKSSKVYIDFGNHPGRDRIPREASLLNNCIITGFRGSSMFYNDLPINSTYKFQSVEGVGELIRDCFARFDYHLENFSLYRSNIVNQKEQMFNQIKQIFL